jgi:hypothetical protein
MAVEEKRWWTYGAVALVVSAIYFAFILSKVAGAPIDEIDFQLPLLVAAGTGALLATIATIVLRIASRIGAPTGAARTDQRDRDINRLGEYVGGIVLAVTMVLPFTLALLAVDQFWIANAMYLAFTMSAVAGSATKVAIYRRGF